MTAEGERRFDARIPVEMWVEERSDRDHYFQRSANLSAGGIFLDRTIPHPVGTAVSLSFSLPGDDEVLKVRGEIVNASEAGHLGMGVKFTRVDAGARARIEAFVRRETDRGASGSA